MGIVLIIIVIVVIIAIFRGKPKVGQIHAGQNHYFDKLQFSSDEFYTLLEKIIEERQMPNTKISRKDYYEGSILSNKREYLRVKRFEDIFDICAAPFGTGFFVSYWFAEPKHTFIDMLKRIPVLGPMVEGWHESSTYYKEDTASMFRACTKDSITEAIGQITTSQGVRGFSELERMAFNK